MRVICTLRERMVFSNQKHVLLYFLVFCVLLQISFLYIFWEIKALEAKYSLKICLLKEHSQSCLIVVGLSFLYGQPVRYCFSPFLDHTRSWPILIYYFLCRANLEKACHMPGSLFCHSQQYRLIETVVLFIFMIINIVVKIVWYHVWSCSWHLFSPRAIIWAYLGYAKLRCVTALLFICLYPVLGNPISILY